MTPCELLRTLERTLQLRTLERTLQLLPEGRPVRPPELPSSRAESLGFSRPPCLQTLGPGDLGVFGSPVVGAEVWQEEPAMARMLRQWLPKR